MHLSPGRRIPLTAGFYPIEEALGVNRIPPDDLNQLLQPLFDPEAKRKAIAEGKLLAKGINAGPGAATGRIKFHAEDAEVTGQQRGGDVQLGGKLAGAGPPAVSERFDDTASPLISQSRQERAHPGHHAGSGAPKYQR